MRPGSCIDNLSLQMILGSRSMKKLIFGFVVMAMLFSGASIFGQSVEEMETLYDEGMELANHSDFYGAAEKWEKGLKIARKISPENISVFIGNLGIVYMELGDYQKAISYYLKKA